MRIFQRQNPRSGSITTNKYNNNKKPGSLLKRSVKKPVALLELHAHCTLKNVFSCEMPNQYNALLCCCCCCPCSRLACAFCFYDDDMFAMLCVLCNRRDCRRCTRRCMSRCRADSHHKTTTETTLGGDCALYGVYGQPHDMHVCMSCCVAHCMRAEQIA